MICEELGNLDRKVRLEIIEKLVAEIKLTENDIEWLEKQLAKVIEKELNKLSKH